MSGALRRAQPWLGTLVEVFCEAAPVALDGAFAVIAEIHRRMSPQEPTSDLARFDAAAAGATIACHADTLAVLQAARDLALLSDGVFDPTLGSGGLAAWSLDGAMLHKHLDAARLDLGGIAKGYAVDRAVEALQAQGAKAGVINAGGDLRVFGDLEWPVHIRHRDDPSQVTPLIALRDGAIATSVLPLPAGGSAHISVAAPQCLWADALTKIVAYALESRSRALLARYDARPFIHDC